MNELWGLFLLLVSFVLAVFGFVIYLFDTSQIDTTFTNAIWFWATSGVCMMGAIVLGCSSYHENRSRANTEND